MNFVIQFFYLVLYQPLLNILVLFYTYIAGHDFGLAVIFLTIIIRFILHPVSMKGLRSQKALTNLQPKIKAIQEKHKNDLPAQNKATMELYRQEGVSPFSGCLPLLLQLPIIIALYQVFLKGLEPAVLQANLYSFIPNPGQISETFLRIFSLQQSAFVIAVALLAGVAQFFQSKMAGPPKTGKSTRPSSPDVASLMQKQTLYIFPLITVFVIWKFGSIIGIYWLVSTLFSIGEQYLVNQRTKKLISPQKYGRKNSKTS